MNSIGIIIASIILSAFFSGMEIAFVTSNKLKIELDKKRGVISAKIMSRFAKSPSNLIATLLVANNIALVIYGLATANLLEPIIIKHLPTSLVHDSSILIIQTIISTLIILVTAEFLPKALFRIRPNYILNLFAPLVWFFYYTLYPIVIIFSQLSQFILKKIFKVDFSEVQPIFSFVDLDNYLREFRNEEHENSSEAAEIQMFQKAIDFRNLKLRECMVPRTEIHSIEINESKDILQKRFIETGFSKMMVFTETIDKIIGYAHAYDMFKNPINIKSILRPVIIVPETMQANKLLTMFIQQQKNVAVVVDEFGGTSGIITIEDIIEEIFGEIEDEFDEDDSTDKKINDNEYIFSGRLEIDYINEKYKLEIPASEDYETLAGYIIEHYESIPKQQETITIDNISFKILQASEKHIEKVLLIIK